MKDLKFCVKRLVISEYSLANKSLIYFLSRLMLSVLDKK